MIIDSFIVINGYDITDWIAEKGVKWSRNDLDGPNAGRNLDGTMIRDLVTTKIRLDVTCHDLNGDDFNTLLGLIIAQYVTVTYNDPYYGVRTVQMYSNNHSAVASYTDEDGNMIWTDISFPLIQR